MMKNLEELKNQDKIKEIKTPQESLKPKDNPKIFTSSTFGENTTEGVIKCNNRRCKICDINTEGKSYSFKNLETKFKINTDLSCNSKNVVYIIESSECK